MQSCRNYMEVIAHSLIARIGHILVFMQNKKKEKIDYNAHAQVQCRDNIKVIYYKWCFLASYIFVYTRCVLERVLFITVRGITWNIINYIPNIPDNWNEILRLPAVWYHIKVSLHHHSRFFHRIKLKRLKTIDEVIDIIYIAFKRSSKAYTF